MRGKRIKDKLAAGRPVFYTGLTFHAPRLVELLARSGIDLLVLDAEHGPLSEAQCEEMVRAADVVDLPILIRVPHNEPHVILRYLDIGTSGIMVPQLKTRADAERLVKAVKYPLAGERGFTTGRGNALLDLSPPAYMRRANEETFTMPLFENVAGLVELEAALQVQGIDALYLGPFDLASSLGLPGQPFHAEVQTVVEQVRQTCRRLKVPFGTVARNREHLREMVQSGDLMIQLDTIPWGIDATREIVSELGGQAT
jgi:4-hydroxy-2-oxoheptanedioate aldolase